jgi:hypothetical protein
MTPGSVWSPVDAVDDDRGVGCKLVSEVGDVSLGMLLQLLGVEPAAVLALKLVLTTNLQTQKSDDVIVDRRDFLKREFLVFFLIKLSPLLLVNVKINQ